MNWLRGSWRRRSRISRLTPVWLLLAACGGLALDAQPITDLRDPRINTEVYECVPGSAETFDFTIRHGATELALWLPARFRQPYLVLSRAEGREEYREGDVVLTFHDGRADLAVGAERFLECVEDPVRSVWEHAKLTGVDFRAAGSDPNWYVEIRRAGELVFRSGDQNTSVPTPEPQRDAVSGVTAYRGITDGVELNVAIGGGACELPDRRDLEGVVVTVTLDGASFLGCGRALH